MWSNFVVIHSPAFNALPGFFHRPEPMQIQAGVPEPAVETFRECILGWLARLDEVQSGLLLLTPEVHRLAGELRAVVAHDALRPGQRAHRTRPAVAEWNQ